MGLELTYQAAIFIKHVEISIKLRIKVPEGAFPEYGIRGSTPYSLRAKEGGVILVGGKRVADGKHKGHLDDDLGYYGKKWSCIKQVDGLYSLFFCELK